MAALNPIPVGVSSGLVNNATATATMLAVAEKVNYITGMAITPGFATASAVVNTTLTFTGSVPLQVLTFPINVPASPGLGDPLAGTFVQQWINEQQVGFQDRRLFSACLRRAGSGGTGAQVTLVGFVQ